jgi:hypothetical protein
MASAARRPEGFLRSNSGRGRSDLAGSAFFHFDVILNAANREVWALVKGFNYERLLAEMVAHGMGRQAKHGS